VQDADAVPICHHCLTQIPPGQWFCETCGTSVGPYNNVMGYLSWFSYGEVLRNGVGARMRASPVVLGGYCLITFNGLMAMMLWAVSEPTEVEVVFMMANLLFFGVFWRSLFKNLFGRSPETKADPGAAAN
jgi:hypothetical protein